jgi:glutamate dehydrogenase
MTAQQDLRVDDWRRDYAAATADRPELAALVDCWPLSYLAVASPARAVADASTLVKLQTGELRVDATIDANQLRVTVSSVERSLTLSEMLPGLQCLGLEVEAEQRFQVHLPDMTQCWLYDFTVTSLTDGTDTGETLRRIADALLAIWTGQVEADRFNELVTTAALDWQRAALLRTYGQYMHQLGLSLGRAYVAEVLNEHPDIARHLSDLFRLRFGADAGGAQNMEQQAQLVARIESAIDAVDNLTADRLLRRLLELVCQTVRTNYFTSFTDNPASAIAIKLDPRSLSFVAEPRPRFEVFISSPRVEGIHLRFGSVARGGLRWSDRHEDLRTEILGLATAQVAKNAVIVPTGAKGGFLVKSGSAARTVASRIGAAHPTHTPALTAYEEFISALLDVHDSLAPLNQEPVRPAGIVAYEGADPYLVVAADKGTASFSDTANAIASSRGFWLGDAFASGGSAGYDHKALGITARGAWRSVVRHFRELGLDPDTTPFTVVGIGDMSGDVFGNGMLLSRQIRLVAAFDHRHIFLDPDPDESSSYLERNRLFELPGSSWADYAPNLISSGGGVYSRASKVIPVSEQLALALGLDARLTSPTPAELVRAILKAPVDLMWNGGIGTYVKASGETHLEVADKVNDALRINADELQARVVGEGGNLGLTQRARIEFALAGGRINTDAIDNSAGVGCSDREVNIKIALDQLVGRGEINPAERAQLLTSMTEGVCRLVLAENTSQNELLGQSRQFAAADLALHARIIGRLEEATDLDRTQLALPDDAEITRRLRDGQGLTSPEMAALTAQVKRELRANLVSDDLPDEPAVQQVLLDYFPDELRAFGPSLFQHPLRREIIATELTNRVIDQAGIGYVQRMSEDANANPGDAVRAFLVASTIFDLPGIWDRIQQAAFDAHAAGELLRESLRVLDSASRWLLSNRPQPIRVDAEIDHLRPVLAVLAKGVKGWLQPNDHADLDRRMEPVHEAVSTDRALAMEVYELIDRYCLLDISEIAQELDMPPLQVAPVYFLVKDRRSINALLANVLDLPHHDRLTALARIGLHDDLYEAARSMCIAVLSTASTHSIPDEALAQWERRFAHRLTNMESIVSASRATGDLIHLAVAARQIRILSMLSTRPGEPDSDLDRRTRQQVNPLKHPAKIRNTGVFHG